jgi:hypothetical protein
MAIKYGKLVRLLTGESESQMPIVMNANSKYDFSETQKTGSVVYVSLADTGTVVVDTDDVTSADMTINEVDIPITLKRYTIPTALTSKELALEVDSKEEQIAKPRAQHIADSIQEAACDALLLGAGSNITVTAATLVNLSDAVASIRNAKCNGEIIGGINPSLASKYVAVAAGSFLKSNDSMFGNLELGHFADAQWYNVPQFTVLSTGNYDLSTSANVAAVTAEGATSLVITDALLTSGVSKIKKGQTFTLAGTYTVDRFGNSIGILKTFVAQADATAVTGAITVTVAPIYFTGAGKNISTASIAGGTVITRGQDKNSSYLRGMVYDKNAFCRGTAKLPVMDGTNAASSSDTKNGFSLRAAAQGNVLTDKYVMRLDALVGFTQARGIFSSSIYVKI